MIAGRIRHVVPQSKLRVDNWTIPMYADQSTGKTQVESHERADQQGMGSAPLFRADAASGNTAKCLFNACTREPTCSGNYRLPGRKIFTPPVRRSVPIRAARRRRRALNRGGLRKPRYSRDRSFLKGDVCRHGGFGQESPPADMALHQRHGPWLHQDVRVTHP